MSHESDAAETQDAPEIRAVPEIQVVSNSVNEIASNAARIEAAPTLTEKSSALWAMPANVRHQTLGALPASLVAALIESAPEANMGLLANVPAAKFVQMTGLGSAAQGRAWLERAVGTGSLAGAMLPSLMTASSLAEMLLTAPDVRRALPRLLNFERAERWRQLLTTNEYHKSIDDLLMADAPELLRKASFKDKSVRAVLESLLDFVPELYLETVRVAMERARYADEHAEELEDLTVTPFGLPETAPPVNGRAVPSANGHSESESSAPNPLADLLPEGGDPVFALVTAGLSAARKAKLEEQLRFLLRQEIVATGSFGQADMARAAGRVLFYLRAGLETLGGDMAEATLALETRDLHDISALGARTAESYRQKALSLVGQREWLDGRQRQFLDALKTPEAGLHPETREPVLWLAGKPKQERDEWHPTPLLEIAHRLADIAAWAALAHAAFGTAERTHAIFGTAKTRTFDEALRRTVIALCLYRRWEPELVRPGEDFTAFARQYKNKKGGMDAARQIILDALDATPDAAWKPSDAKARARELLLRAVTELETAPPATAT